MEDLSIPSAGDSRRAFIKNAAAAAAAIVFAAKADGLPAVPGGSVPGGSATGGTVPEGSVPGVAGPGVAGGRIGAGIAADPMGLAGNMEGAPWWRRVTRWGQVNITEKDPAQYDIAWWRAFWKRTETQGIIANAGGIIAYYPTKIPLHRKSEYLGDRDLFGDLCRAAHEDGLAVFARMDSNRAHEEFYRAHPDWFALDGTGRPYRADDLYITCINSPYYNEHIPAILQEIAGLYHPEGFTDNSWSGLGRESICYCENCRKNFRDKTGYTIPVAKSWDDPVYRRWIQWNYERRLEVWDLNNRITKAAGGEHCIWSGMNSGSLTGQAHAFRDFKAICERAEILMLDDQARSDSSGLQRNGETGPLIHGLLGWDKLIPESMAMYQAHDPWFRLASKPEPEARMWVIEGIAGGIQPWWHIVGASHEDRRVYHNPEKIFRWHRQNEEFLINRKPMATVGVVWSQQNIDYYGRDHAGEWVEEPWRGLGRALMRARIPYTPVHADHIDRDGASFSLLILPNLGAMTDEQVAAVRRFVERGGGLVATGDSSLFDQWGDPRADYALADLFGAHLMQPRKGPGLSGIAPREKLAGEVYHTYLRLSGGGAGAGASDGKRHEIFAGFEETDIIPFGGWLEPLRVDAEARVLMTFIPQFPVYPPEKAWMREPKTDIPGVIVREGEKGGRVAFLPAGLDRLYGLTNLPDHGNLLKNIIRWAAREDIPLLAEGAGLFDFHLYSQGSRLVLHIVNLSSPAAWMQPMDELIPVGPLKIRVHLPDSVTGMDVRLLVSGAVVTAGMSKRWIRFVIPSITDHEVVVIS